MSNLRRCLLVFLVAAGCGAPVDNPAHTPACAALNWRAATAGAIACPGTTDCACPVADVCCVDYAAAYTDTGGTVGGAACGKLTACAGIALACDGPEDCGAGKVCCFLGTTGGNSTCKSAADCTGVDQVVMCRSDTDCASGDHCEPAAAGAYFASIAGSCKL